VEPCRHQGLKRHAQLRHQPGKGRFFPADAGVFDIVVFDEASQVRVADAIGAVGRA
jgi:hypothetical protein